MYTVLSVNRGEFNNASARRALVDWYLSLFITWKAGHQYNERPRALALLNLPQVQVSYVIRPHIDQNAQESQTTTRVTKKNGLSHQEKGLLL